MSNVEAGQLWVDNDPRNHAKRFVSIKSVDDTHATCESWYDEAGARSRTTRIRLARFRAVDRTGYRPATDDERRLAGIESDLQK